VGKHTVPPVTFENMKELTPVKNPMYASNVEKPLVLPVASKYMK
jgi:hypothetical protein